MCFFLFNNNCFHIKGFFLRTSFEQVAIHRTTTMQWFVSDWSAARGPKYFRCISMISMFISCLNLYKFEKKMFSLSQQQTAQQQSAKGCFLTATKTRCHLHIHLLRQMECRTLADLTCALKAIMLLKSKLWQVNLQQGLLPYLSFTTFIAMYM